MFSFLTDLQIDLVLVGVSLACGVIFSTKIKDFVKGVPAELRAALKSTETSALSAVNQAKADAIAKVLPAAAPAKAPEPVAAAPVAKAPEAPAPAAAPAAAA